MPDIGGRIRAIEARELFEEGFHIPLTHLMRGGPGGRDAARPPARQRADAGPDGGRHLRAGERERADGEPGAPPDGRVRARLARGPGRRALRPLRARDARRDSQGPRRHLPLRDRDRRLRGALSLPRRAHGAGRRDRGRLHRHLARAAARHQLRDGLHVRDDGLRGPLRAAAGAAQQRGHVPAGEGRGARGLPAQPEVPGRGGEPRADRALRADPDPGRAAPGDSRPRRGGGGLAPLGGGPVRRARRRAAVHHRALLQRGHGRDRGEGRRARALVAQQHLEHAGGGGGAQQPALLPLQAHALRLGRRRPLRAAGSARTC